MPSGQGERGNLAGSSSRSESEAAAVKGAEKLKEAWIHDHLRVGISSGEDQPYVPNNFWLGFHRGLGKK